MRRETCFDGSQDGDRRGMDRMEMETVREGLSLSDTMRKGLDDMLSRLDRQEDSHESQKERDCH